MARSVSAGGCCQGIEMMSRRPSSSRLRKTVVLTLPVLRQTVMRISGTPERGHERFEVGGELVDLGDVLAHERPGREVADDLAQVAGEVLDALGAGRPVVVQ